MIDIIVVDFDNGDVYKTLFSIYIQTIREKVNVILVSSKKYKNLSFFREKIKIEEVITKEKSLGKRRQIGLDKAKGDYITFMQSGDCFYDIFALNNIYKICGEYDAVIGGIENSSKKYSNYYLVGNLYQRKYLTLHHIEFRDSNGLENGFHQTFFLSHPKVIFSKDLIYHEMKPNCKSHDLLLDMIQDTFYALDKAKKREYTKRQIARMIYDSLLYYAYVLEKEKSFEKDLMEAIKKLIKEYDFYQKFLLEEDFQYISSLNLTNKELDKQYFKELMSIAI